ncbi:MAG: fumarate hydratase [Candidatus Margulisbacteria bacterium]|nr:fumarate hydratase [Candidatus Margulisiibacteriota bacterium]
MRVIPSKLVVQKIADALIDINFNVDSDILKYFQSQLPALKDNEKRVIQILVENANIAAKNKIPLCQDTGTVVIFARIGQHVAFEKNLQTLIDEAVSSVYKQQYLRKSIVNDPLSRINTQDNTPAILHLEMIQGDTCEFGIMVKGGGAENASSMTMLEPAAGEEGIIDLIVKVVAEKGRNACPPLILGVGLGGNFETCTLLAKKALFRNIGQRNIDAKYAKLENKILKKVNELKIGAGGYGGKLTAMEVFIETAPCHIASMPVAVNVSCHSTRHTWVRV